MVAPRSPAHPAPGSNPERQFDWIGLAELAAIVGIVTWLWDTIFVYPLRLLVVYLHEISHALAAITTGGRVIEIQLSRMEGGHCVTAGGSQFVIFSAGYLGSMLFGVVILLLSRRTRAARGISLVLGGMLVLATLMHVPVMANKFGFAFGIVGGGLLAALSNARRFWADLALRTVGVTSCLYAPLDIYSDVIARPGSGSDAHRLASLTGVPEMLWGVVWIIASGVVAVITLKHALLVPPRLKNRDGAVPAQEPASKCADR